GREALVDVGMHVDEARRHDEAVQVDPAPAIQLVLGHGGDLLALDAYRPALRAIGQHGILQDNVHHADLLLFDLHVSDTVYATAPVSIRGFAASAARPVQ